MLAILTIVASALAIVAPPAAFGAWEARRRAMLHAVYLAGFERGHGVGVVEGRRQGFGAGFDVARQQALLRVRLTASPATLASIRDMQAPRWTP